MQIQSLRPGSSLNPVSRPEPGPQRSPCARLSWRRSAPSWHRARLPRRQLRLSRVVLRQHVKFQGASGSSNFRAALGSSCGLAVCHAHQFRWYSTDVLREPARKTMHISLGMFRPSPSFAKDLLVAVVVAGRGGGGGGCGGGGAWSLSLSLFLLLLLLGWQPFEA